MNDASRDPYTSSVFHGGLHTDLNGMYDGMYRVKFDTVTSTPCWKVRNSWSETGFVRVPKDVNACALVQRRVTLGRVA